MLLNNKLELIYKVRKRSLLVFNKWVFNKLFDCNFGTAFSLIRYYLKRSKTFSGKILSCLYSLKLNNFNYKHDKFHSFLVGGDGNLYEGRGWEYESGITPEKQQGKNYNIAFIGDYQGNTSLTIFLIV